MQIDQQNGSVTLPNGTSIFSVLTQDDFRTNLAFANAQSYDCGTLPWIHYRFDGGQIAGKELRVRLCFYDQMLVYVTLEADHYPPGGRDWSNYSLEIESETKHFHDRLLEQMLGPPSRGGSFFFRRIPEQTVTLERPLSWKFRWGIVSSGHDFKGGGTEIVVSYGNRKEQANWAYRRTSAST